ncbi:MAG: hypothetical protein ABWK53_03850 [Anaerolineales bacterium]
MSIPSRPSGNWLASLLGLVQKVTGRGAPPPAAAPVPADNLTDPAVIVTNRVLLIVYDPIMEAASRERLSQTMKWNRVDDLIGGFIQDILETSGGMARYEVVERVLLDEFPAKVDGYRYTPAAYLEVMRGAPPHKPEEIDYQAILTGYNVLPRIAKREIDEVWLFGFPHAGFYESCMGGAGAFWCNAPPLRNTARCPRRFVVMGFSFERSVGEMLEAFGHRAEAILSKVFEKATGEANLYARFSRYEKNAPGKAAVGTIHFAPNSQREYDWGNPTKVLSECYDWLNFPEFRGDLREVDANEWGGGDIRAHHRWWLAHLPKVAGRTAGVANNWWQYIMDPNLVNL